MGLMETTNKARDSIGTAYAYFYECYADDAAFLWLLRTNAVNQPHYDRKALAELDERIQAQLNGLMTAPEEAWNICESSLSLQQPGEVFVASVIAFRSLDIRKIQIAVEAGLSDAGTFDALVSAMAWLPGRLVHSWIKKFLISKDLDHKYLALAVCSARREDPREYLNSILQRADCLAHEKLYACALRLIGVLKRFDLLPALRTGSSAENKIVKFWSLWSQILLGDKQLAVQLDPWVFNENPLQHTAIELCFRSLPVEIAREWISRLAKNPDNIRATIHASTVLGDPQAINWLLIQMRTPVLSRVSAEAFSTITGIDLEAHKLVLDDIPELDNYLPDDGAKNEEFYIDDDQHLPFPDTNKIAAVWQKYQQRFALGHRYFMGQKLANNQQHLEYLQGIFNSGMQRQRSAAALEISLYDTSQYLLDHTEKSIKDD